MESKEKNKMPRTILVHLNVEVPDTDTRSANEIADAILDTLSDGGDGDERLIDLVTVCPLAEEVGDADIIGSTTYPPFLGNIPKG